jgi:hypothetical protein
MSSTVLRRSTAAALVAGLVSLTSPGALCAGSPSTLSGRVLTQNGADPRSGVVVTLIEPASEQAFRSSPTDATGAFTIDTAPAGNYALVVVAPEGAFLAANNLQLAPGVNRPLSLALKPGKQDQPPAPAPTPAPTPAPDSGTPASPPAAKPKGAVPTWAKWVIAGGIIVGGAIIIDAVTSDSNEASSFSPVPD